MTTINESTSVIAVKTKQLTAGQTSVVYVSSSSDVGHLATVFDVQGYLSAPQSILVSSVQGVDLGPGLSTIRIQQRFGYVTLRSNTPTSWGVVDENAFRTAAADYVTQGLQFSTIDASTMRVTSTISTTTVSTRTFHTSNASFLGPLFVSSVGPSTFLMNSLSNSGTYVVQSTLSVAQAASFLSTASTLGPVAVQNSLAVNGAFTSRSTIYLQSSLLTTQRILVNSNITVQGLVTVSSNIQCFANANTSTTVATTTSARTFITNNIVFDNAQLRPGPNASLYISSSLYVPSAIQTSTLTVDNISTQSLTVLSTIFTPAFSAENAAIRNAQGSLSISSIQANSIQYTTLYGSNATSSIISISTQTGLFSTLRFNNALYANTIDIRNGYINSLFSDYILVNSIVSGGGSGLNLDTMSLSTITISSAFIAPQMSSFVAPNARIDAAQIITSDMQLNSIVTSSLSGVTSIHGTGPLTLSTAGLYTSSIAGIRIIAAELTTSSITLSNAILGRRIAMDPTAPYFLPSSLSGLSSNTPSEFIQGLGTPYSPFHVVATRDREAAAYVVSGPRTAYLTMNYSYATTAPSTTGSASIILKNPIVQSTIVTLSSTTLPGYQTYSLSNYPIDTKVVSSIYTYNLVGPMTYALPEPQQTLVAGGNAFHLAYSSDGGNKWVQLPYVGFESGTFGAAYGSDKWVVVGNGVTNTMMFSYTGTVWYDLGKTIFFSRGIGIAYNGTRWVALGQGGNTIASSPDGVSWTGFGGSIFTLRGNAAASDGTTWIAVGEGGDTLARSADNGSSWTGLGMSVFSSAGYGVAYNGSLWVAVGSGTNTLATSPDGITWTGFGTTVFQTEGRVVAWNGSYWLAGSSLDPYAQIARSVDGVTWTPVSCPIGIIYSLTWTGTQWIAGGTGNPCLATSPDGLVWTPSSAATGLFTTAYAIATPTGFATPPPLIVAVGSGGNYIITSPDGVSWTSRTSPMTTSVNCVAWNGSLWVAGGLGTYKIATSPDGIIWTGIAVANIILVNSVAWGKGKWIAVGLGGGGYTRAESTDGITWTAYPSTTGNFFSSVAYGIVWAQGLWIATGTPEGSGILFSLDGSNWIPQIESIFTSGRCVASNGTMFLAGGTGTYRMAYSLEGSVWAPVTSCPMTMDVYDIAWGGGVWVAVGRGTHSLAYSYNGMDWIGLGTSVFTVTGTGIAWTGSGWVATGVGTNSLATSLDGIIWEGQGSSLFGNAKDVAVSPIILPNTEILPPEPVGIRWDLSGVALLTPSIAEKPARTNPGYDSYARSRDGYTNSAFLQFRPYQLLGSCYIGLTTATTPLTAISYAFSLTDTQQVEILEAGILVASLGSFQISDTFQIVFDGVKFAFQKNSVEVLSFPRSPGLPLFLEAQFNLGGTRLYDLEFHPLNQITENGATIPNQFYTTSRPTGLLNSPISFTRPIIETVFPPSLWEIAIPMSGTLVTPSSQVYADVFLSTSRLFSTAVLQTALDPVVSTYTLRYTLSTAVTTVPGDTLDVRLYTQHSRGSASIYSTTLTTSVYNLSSVQYVDLVHNSSTMGGQTSDFSLWIQSVSTPATTNYVASNSGIEMNRGFLRWNGRQYGITIQNQYNDMQTRSLTYTGALYTASDSNLKHDTAYANTEDLYNAVATLPLHRYTLLGSYRDRFRTEDANQLGVLTTEVSNRFPSMIKVVDSEFLPDLQTVDRIQFRYAHLGATQHIIERISTLRSKIKSKQM